MMFRSSRLVASLCLATAASCISAPIPPRPDARRAEALVQHMAPISREEAREIIFEMAPLQPVKKNAVAATLEHTPATQAKAEPTLAAKSAETPKPARGIAETSRPRKTARAGE